MYCCMELNNISFFLLIDVTDCKESYFVLIQEYPELIKKYIIIIL